MCFVYPASLNLSFLLSDFFASVYFFSFYHFIRRGDDSLVFPSLCGCTLFSNEGEEVKSISMEESFIKVSLIPTVKKQEKISLHL